MTSAFILIDKPAGITSFKSLGAIKKQFGTKRVGHAGTLDMSASGLIVAAVGKCTRLLPYIESQEKVYTFDLHLGYLTDTLEPTGNIIRDCRGDPRGRPFDEHGCPSYEQLSAVLQSFIGEIEQIPPAYSAVKINGKRASDLVLKGKDVELKSRKISIYDLHIVCRGDPCGRPFDEHGRPFESTIIPIYCRCSKGTYIRSLARDIAEKLGTCGVAGNIRRLSIGKISVESAVGADLCVCPYHPIPPQQIFNWQIIDINDEDAKKILNGVPIPFVTSVASVGADLCVCPCENKTNENNVFLSNNNNIIAVAELQNEYLIPKFQI